MSIKNENYKTNQDETILKRKELFDKFRAKN